MRAVVFNGPYDVSVETVADPAIRNPTDVIVQITASGVCGSDLWTYRGEGTAAPGARIGHEFTGTVVETGSDVKTVDVGDWVISPFRYSDGVCEFCAAGLPSSCVNGGFWGRESSEAGQGEYVRVPFADGTLVKALPDGAAPDPAAVPDLLALADVLPTGWHAVTSARVRPGSTVVIVGDGAVGLSAVIAARLSGADRIILLGGRHRDRQQLAREFGASDVVSARGDEAVETVRELTAGRLAEHVVEGVGTADSFATALAVTRPGGAVGYVGIPHGVRIDLSQLFARNIAIGGGLAPARQYLPALLATVLAGEIHPGRVFTSRLDLENAAEAYRLMDERRTTKALLSPAGVTLA